MNVSNRRCVNDNKTRDRSSSFNICHNQLQRDEKTLNCACVDDKFYRNRSRQSPTIANNQYRVVLQSGFVVLRRHDLSETINIVPELDMKPETLPDNDASHLTNRLANSRTILDDQQDCEKHNSDSSEKKLVSEMAAEELRERMEEIRQEILSQVNNRLNDMMSEVLQKMKTVPSRAIKDILYDPEKYRDKRKSSKEGILPDKEYISRNSMLVELFEVKHIRAIYNVFIAIMIILFINTAVYDIMETGRVSIGINTIALGFGKLTTVAIIWLQMMVTTFSTYVIFNFWGHRRLDFHPKSALLKMWDYGWLAMFILYQIAFMIVPAKAVVEEDLPPASSLIILMEEVRILMKTHAFIRTNAPLFLSYKPHSETVRPTGPGFSQYLYFMFAPTLVYRDSYPRTEKIRWKFVVWNFTEVIMVIFCVAFTFERCLAPVYQNFGKHPIELRTLVLAVLGTSMPGTLVFLCGFYCLLHSWMNAWAELMRFADRMFYKDWWNSTSYGFYYRTWNVVVHDWLYMYIYKDMYEIVTPRNKILSMSMVFLVSAIYHEFILTFALRFFYPVLLLLISVFSMSLVCLKKSIGNVLVWWSLLCGTGIVLSLYTIEYYSRFNCPTMYDGILDYVLPRSWLCHKITNDWNFTKMSSV